MSSEEGRLEGGDPLTDGVAGEFDATAAAQFAHEPGAIGFDGFDPHVEEGGDFLGAFTEGDQAEEFLFAGGEQGMGGGGAGGGATEEALDEAAGDFRGEVGMAGEDAAQGTDEFGGAGVFGEVTADTGAEGAFDEGGIGVTGKGEEPGGGADLLHGVGHLDTVFAGQMDIDEDDIGDFGAGEFEGFGAVAGVANHLHIRLFGNQQAEAFAHHFVVIDQQDFCGDYRHRGAW